MWVRNRGNPVAVKYSQRVCAKGATHMSENTKTKPEAIEISVPKTLKSEINKLASAQKKSARVMQERMLALGEKLALVKDKYCAGDTKSFGKWLDDNCPNLHINYVAFYIEMHKSRAEVIALLKTRPHLTSAQTIVRAIRDARKSKDAQDDGKGKGKKKSTKTETYKPDGKSLKQLLADAQVIHERIRTYKNAQDYTSALKETLAKMGEELIELSK